MLAVRAVKHVSPQCCGAALFNSSHDLELAHAQVGALSKPPGWPMGAKDVRHLQGTRPHWRGLCGLQRLQRTDHLSQHVGGYLCVKGRGLQLLVTQEHLDDANVDLLLEQVSCETVA